METTIRRYILVRPKGGLKVENAHSSVPKARLSCPNPYYKIPKHSLPARKLTRISPGHTSISRMRTLHSREHTLKIRERTFNSPMHTSQSLADTQLSLTHTYVSAPTLKTKTHIITCLFYYFKLINFTAMATKTLADKLESSRVLIFNSRDAEVAALLNKMGIDTAYIEVGEALYNETMTLFDQQKKEYQQQSLAYDKFYVEKDTAEVNYKRTLKLVKVLSRSDQDLQNRLGLQNGKVYAIEQWIEEAVDLYNRLLNESEFLTKLEKFKVTTDQLNAEKTAIDDLKDLRNQAVLEKGQAQEATRLKNEKLDQLEDYCTELKAIAEIALEEKPQLLEKLGILVRS